MMATIGTKDFDHYRGMTTNQGFCKSVLFQCDGVSGHYREGGHTSGVAIKRGSTVYNNYYNNDNITIVNIFFSIAWCTKK